MSVPDVLPLTQEQLCRTLAAVEPAVLLVSGRLLRRLIKQHRQVPTFGLQVPHADSYTLRREELLQLANPAELNLPTEGVLPEHLILLPEPEPALLAAMTPALVLRDYWRRLFHARVHLTLEQRLGGESKQMASCNRSPVASAELRRRIHCLGIADFDEIRSVLQEENRLLPPGDDRETYLEFAAFYLELRWFAPTQIEKYFSGIDNLEKVDMLLAEDLDAGTLWRATRPAGAADTDQTTANEQALSLTGSASEDSESGNFSLRLFERGAELLGEIPPVVRADFPSLVYRATQAQQRGNAVRAAVLLFRAAACGADTLQLAQQQLLDLVERLRVVQELPAAEVADWRRLVLLLLPAASRRFWPVERRFLYDLQKICLDKERGVYTLNNLGWLLSLGRRPWRQSLPFLSLVRAVKHLRRAAQRVPYLTLKAQDRQVLSRLLRQAQVRAEEHLRQQCGPVLRQALDQVCLRPVNLPEEVARDKLIEELLDRVVDVGYLTMSDLRDAISRNQLKLPDLGACADAMPPERSPQSATWAQRLGMGFRAFYRAVAELAAGDPLLHLNRLLPQRLAGIYRRGEIYLRALQRFSSLAFGTVSGRFLTRYVAVPLGGAYVLLRGLDHLLHPLWRHLDWRPVHLARWPAIALLGGFFWLLLNVSGFRWALGRGLQLLARGIYVLFGVWPVWLWSLPWIQQLLHSPPYRFFRRYLLVPLLLGGVVWQASLWAGQTAEHAWELAGSTFLASVLFLASRLGRDLGEYLADSLVHLWQRLSLDLVPNLVRWILELFRTLVELVTRFLYSVDEWLLFRAGESRRLLFLKGLFGLCWFFLTYVIRFAVDVLIEPQINPIKHFPVVTVSHKLVWSLAIVLAPSVAGLMGWEPTYALMILSSIAWAIPGMFGFIAWELKENWYLYRANRPAVLRPAALGPHGETMVRLLRWGFYSGTVPKLFRRRRKAEQQGRWATARRCQQTLQHVAEVLSRFVERELVTLLAGSAAWAGQRLRIGRITLAHHHLRLEVFLPTAPHHPLVLVLFEHAGWLLAGWGATPALATLTPRQRCTLAAALLGLYKQAGIMLVQEQIRHRLPFAQLGFKLTRTHLILWPAGSPCCEVHYDLLAGPLLKPRLFIEGEDAEILDRSLPKEQQLRQEKNRELPVVPVTQLLFSQTTLRWIDWVAFWEQERAGQDPQALLPDWHVLPIE